MSRADKIYKQLTLLDEPTYAFALIISAEYPLWKTYFKRILEERDMRMFRKCLIEALRELPKCAPFNPNAFQLAKGIREGYVWPNDKADVV